ncbi:MAG TPA: CHAD domain-containing protein [Microthrixaceae bacterium]|nr:CHAD domain-containing protein [Microthrixaceae bacterium]
MAGMSEGGNVDAWQLGPADREQSAARILALILGGYLETFRDCEVSVRADLDPEELHRFRVSLRRARSILDAGTDVFPAEELILLSALASWFATVTSPVRDLDVLLAAMASLNGALVPEMADAGEALDEALVVERGAAQLALVHAMDGERYPVLLRRWQTMSTVFRVGGGEPGPDAHRPMGEVADELVMASFRRLRKRGKLAMKTDDLDAWHDLRKAIKRFRYLVAAFAPMYPAGTFKKVLRHLTDLQDTLGRLQDYHVHAAIVERVGVEECGRAALAAGVVADSLHRDASMMHAHCRDAWTEFDRPKLRRQVHAALAG